MAAYGGPGIIRGDWNATPEEAPALLFTTSGTLHYCNEAEAVAQVVARAEDHGQHGELVHGSLRLIILRRSPHSNAVKHSKLFRRCLCFFSCLLD